MTNCFLKFKTISVKPAFYLFFSFLRAFAFFFFAFNSFLVYKNFFSNANQINKKCWGFKYSVWFFKIPSIDENSKVAICGYDS